VKRGERARYRVRYQWENQHRPYVIVCTDPDVAELRAGEIRRASELNGRHVDVEVVDLGAVAP